MLLSPEKGRKIIEGWERAINDSLLLIGVASNLVREGLYDMLEEVAEMRFATSRAHGFYSGPLYWDVFGLAPAENIAYRLQRLRRNYNAVMSTVPVFGLDPSIIADKLRHFYNQFGYGCEEGEMTRERIVIIVAEYETDLREISNASAFHHA